MISVDQFEYDIDKFDFVAEKSAWEEMPPLICTYPREALCAISDAKKTYIWSATGVLTEHICTDADFIADGDGSRRLWTVFDLHEWTLWSHDNDGNEDEEPGWKRANLSNKINEDFPNRPPKYLEITNYIDSSKTHLMESLYKRYQLTHYAM